MVQSLGDARFVYNVKTIIEWNLFNEFHLTIYSTYTTTQSYLFTPTLHVTDHDTVPV